jgi:protein SCO1
MNSLLTTLLTAALLSPFVGAQAAGHSPSRDLEATDLGATQLDTIGVMVDRDLEFTDERGYPFKLKQWFPGDQPVILMLGYYTCPAMCGQVLDAALHALNGVDLQPGEDYRMLNVSIDPRETAETAAARKGLFLPRLIKTGGDSAWRVLVGTEENSKALAESVGFQFYWTEAVGQYSHPPSLIFLTPEGRVSRVIVNTYFEPDDVRLALVEASEGTLGTFWDQVKLSCLTFDPRTNSYSLAVMTLMRIGGAVTVVVLAAMIWIMLRRERQKAQSTDSTSPSTGTANPATSQVG